MSLLSTFTPVEAGGEARSHQGASQGVSPVSTKTAGPEWNVSTRFPIPGVSVTFPSFSSTEHSALVRKVGNLDCDTDAVPCDPLPIPPVGLAGCRLSGWRSLQAAVARPSLIPLFTLHDNEIGPLSRGEILSNMAPHVQRSPFSIPARGPLVL